MNLSLRFLIAEFLIRKKECTGSSCASFASAVLEECMHRKKPSLIFWAFTTSAPNNMNWFSHACNILCYKVQKISSANRVLLFWYRVFDAHSAFGQHLFFPISRARFFLSVLQNFVFPQKILTIHELNCKEKPVFVSFFKYISKIMKRIWRADEN